MKSNLFINFYQDKNEARQRELLICVLANVYNEEIDTVNILVSNRDSNSLMALMEKIKPAYHPKISIIPFNNRPALNDYFRLTQKYPQDINIIANKDIILDVNSLKRLKYWEWKNYFLALTRWDFINNKLEKDKAVFYNQPDSQDTWITKGIIPQVNGGNIKLGTCGVDNKIAYLLQNHYEVINPSLEIKTYHLHLTNIRNYMDRVGRPIERIPPPYKIIQPTILT